MAVKIIMPETAIATLRAGILTATDMGPERGLVHRADRALLDGIEKLRAHGLPGDGL